MSEQNKTDMKKIPYQAGDMLVAKLRNLSHPEEDPQYDIFRVASVDKDGVELFDNSGTWDYPLPMEDMWKVINDPGTNGDNPEYGFGKGLGIESAAGYIHDYVYFPIDVTDEKAAETAHTYIKDELCKYIKDELAYEQEINDHHAEDVELESDQGTWIPGELKDGDVLIVNTWAEYEDGTRINQPFAFVVDDVEHAHDMNDIKVMDPDNPEHGPMEFNELHQYYNENLALAGDCKTGVDYADGFVSRQTGKYYDLDTGHSEEVVRKCRELADDVSREIVTQHNRTRAFLDMKYDPDKQQQWLDAGDDEKAQNALLDGWYKKDHEYLEDQHTKYDFSPEHADEVAEIIRNAANKAVEDHGKSDAGTVKRQYKTWVRDEKPEAKKPSYEHIKVPAGLVKGPFETTNPKTGKNAKYDIVYIPLDNKSKQWGTMKVADQLVQRGKTNKTPVVLALDPDKPRSVEIGTARDDKPQYEHMSAADIHQKFDENWKRYNLQKEVDDAPFHMSGVAESHYTGGHREVSEHFKEIYDKSEQQAQASDDRQIDGE